MAQPVVADPGWNWGTIVSAVLGAVGGFSIAFLPFLTGSKKNDIDESALILTKYKELADTFKSQVESLQGQFNDFKVAAAAEKATLTGEIDNLRMRVRQLEDENAGLKRALAQNSQSAAVLLQRNQDIDSSVEKLSRVGDNIRRGLE